MPNWCQNGITISHKDPAMMDRLQQSKDGVLMEFLPTPQELLDTVAGFSADPERQANLEKEQNENKAKYGYPDWYSWNITNWGTKWDITLENVDRVDENTITAAFNSAWSPPLEAYQKLREMGFDIEAYYFEPGMCFVGKWEDGYDECIEYNTATSKTVRDLIGEELDDYFNVSEMMAELEESQD